MNQEELIVLRGILHTLRQVEAREVDNMQIMRLESAIKSITKLIDGDNNLPDNYPDTNEPSPDDGYWSCEGIDESQRVVVILDAHTRKYAEMMTGKNLAKQVETMKKAMGIS